MDLHDKETYYGNQYKNAWTDFQRRRRTFYDPFDSFSKGGSHFGYGEGEGGSHHPGAGVFLRRSRHFAEEREDRRNQRYRAGIGIGVTGIPPSGIAPFRHPERRETSYVR